MGKRKQPSAVFLEWDPIITRMQRSDLRNDEYDNDTRRDVEGLWDKYIADARINSLDPSDSALICGLRVRLAYNDKEYDRVARIAKLWLDQSNNLPRDNVDVATFQWEIARATFMADRTDEGMELY